MKVAALLSGGKDSIFAIWLAVQNGWEVKYLITVFPERDDSYMYHYPNIKLTKLQAEAMGIPIITISSKCEKEVELEDLKSALAKISDEIDGVISGAIYSKYQKTRIERVCAELRLEAITPLWKLRPAHQWDEMLRAGFKIIMSAVAADGLTEDWLGKELDRAAVEKLKWFHNTCYVCTGGEGGEFETLVVDCPLFKKRLEIIDAVKIWEGNRGRLEVRRARLVEKQ
jgi:ABC transporter with metal-binding/Fe-S-binding domain ATP-binding protein